MLTLQLTLQQITEPKKKKKIQGTIPTLPSEYGTAAAANGKKGANFLPQNYG